MSTISIVLTILFWVAVILICWFIFVEIVVRAIRRFIHFPIPPFLTRLIDNPVRRKIFPTERVTDHLDIQEGMKILEIGPGSGFYSFDVAQRTGLSGQVFAVDIEPKVIARLKQKIARKNVRNIRTIVASAYELPLSDNSIDRAFMVAVLAEIPDRKKALLEIKRVLREDGLLAIGELLFDPDYPRRKTVIGWCKDTGFKLVSSYGNVLHYVLIFKKL